MGNLHFIRKMEQDALGFVSWGAAIWGTTCKAGSENTGRTFISGRTSGGVQTHSPRSVEGHGVYSPWADLPKGETSPKRPLQPFLSQAVVYENGGRAVQGKEMLQIELTCLNISEENSVTKGITQQWQVLPKRTQAPLGCFSNPRFFREGLMYNARESDYLITWANKNCNRRKKCACYTPRF